MLYAHARMLPGANLRGLTTGLHARSIRGVPTTSKALPLQRPEPLRVGVVLANNFTLSAFALFVDHLRLAADEGDRSRPLHVQWSTMSSRSEPLRASCGVTISW